jgi:hypothetical protein
MDAGDRQFRKHLVDAAVAHRPQTIALADRVIHLGPPAEPLPSRQALAS